MVRFKNNYDVLNILCLRDASEKGNKLKQIHSQPLHRRRYIFLFVLFENIGEYGARERKIKNACRHLCEKRGL